MTAPVLTGEIVGFRQWRVTPNLELRAAAHVYRDTWKSGDNEAVCRRLDPMLGWSVLGFERPPVHPCGDTPGEECACGFYGLHSPNDFWYGEEADAKGSWAGLLVTAPDPDPLLSGVIVGWGNVQVHHQGFRSEFARVAALALPRSKRDATVARAVAAAYDVPCVDLAMLPKIADEFGATVPPELRPASTRTDIGDELSRMAAAMGLGQISPSFLSQALYRSSIITGHTTWTAPAPSVPPAPAPASPPATWPSTFKQRIDQAIDIASPGDGKVSDAIQDRRNWARQGPPRPRRAPRNLGKPGL